MKIIPEEHIGKKYNNWTIVSFAGKGNMNQVLFNVKCDCGNEEIKPLCSIKKSKGECRNCFSGIVKHGLSSTHLNKVWRDIKGRTNPNCKNSNLRNYAKYGIKVCREWAEDFMNFYKWAIANGYTDEMASNGKHKWTIDRIDPYGDYCPENCRWATQTEQSRNKTNHIFLEYKGETKKLFEWCEYLNIPYKITARRLRDGWSVERAFEEKRWNTFKGGKEKQNV